MRIRRWSLGLFAGLAVIGFIMMLRVPAPGPEGPAAVRLPKPEELGQVLPAEELQQAAPAAEQGIPPAPRRTRDRLIPPPQVQQKLEKDGSVVY